MADVPQARGLPLRMRNLWVWLSPCGRVTASCVSLCPVQHLLLSPLNLLPGKTCFLAMGEAYKALRCSQTKLQAWNTTSAACLELCASG